MAAGDRRREAAIGTEITRRADAGFGTAAKEPPGLALAYFRPEGGWADALRRTVAQFAEDHCERLAAQLAFYGFLSLYPALVSFLALIARLPVQHQVDSLLRVLSAVTPPEVVEVIRREAARAAGASAGLVAFSAGGALCGTSMAAVTLMDALNAAFDVTDRRQWVKQRALGLALSAMLSGMLLMVLLLLLAGPALSTWAGVHGAPGGVLAIVRHWLVWPLIVVPALVSTALVYHLGPSCRRPWLWITPGSIVATGLWLLTSLAFTSYARDIVDYRASYGVTGAVVIVGLVWFYLSALAVLAGGELDGVLYQSWRDRAGEPAVPGGDRGGARCEVAFFPVHGRPTFGVRPTSGARKP